LSLEGILMLVNIAPSCDKYKKVTGVAQGHYIHTYIHKCIERLIVQNIEAGSFPIAGGK
jgi:hypothetical protein